MVGGDLREETEPLTLGSSAAQVYSNTPETINLIIEVFVEVAHKQICYLGEVSPPRGVSAQRLRRTGP